MSDVTRPAVRWHGGKFLLAPWIIEHFPPHRCYVEPFGGGGSVLLRKPRSHAEIYNDLDDEIVTLFRVLRDPVQSARLVAALRLTPFARAEFEAAYRPGSDPLEVSRCLLVRSFMGFGSDGHNAEIKTGFRANSNRSGTTPAQDWANYPETLRAIVDRVRGIVIEHRDACQVMQAHDAPDTLHYVDPPYMPETRSRKSRRGKLRYHAYRHEMSEADHAAMLQCLIGLQGMVVLSGYPSQLYSSTLAGWREVRRASLADGARERVEVLWLNPTAANAMKQMSLWNEVAA